MLKFWYMASGYWGAQCLLELTKRGVFPDLVITSNPKPFGRGFKLRPNKVDEVANSLKLNIWRSENINLDEALEEKLAAQKLDVIIVIDFGQKVREPYLSTPKFGCINLHPSLLPKYRGAAPIQRALMDGQKVTGVTVFKLTELMDAGPILAQEEVPIDIDDTTGTLSKKLLPAGVDLLVTALNLLITGTAQFKEQDESAATYAPKITNEEAFFDFDEKATEIHNKVRALNPKPGAYTYVNNKRLKVWKTKLINKEETLSTPRTILSIYEGFPVIACGKGAVSLREVQWEGKAIVDGRSFINGLRLREGDVLP